jgi:hypothetical protein
MMVRMERPIISAAVKPKSRSAERFQDTTIPFRSLLMIASSLDSTMAAKCRASRSSRRASVMSRTVFEAPTTSPSGASIGETVNETSMRRPSLRMRTVS